MSFRVPWPVPGTQQVLNKCQHVTPKSVTLPLAPILVDWGGGGREEQVRR